MIIGVLFDCDGVLIDSMPFHVQAWQQVMTRYGIKVDPLEIYQQEGATSMEVAAEIFNRHRKSASPELIQNIVCEKRDLYLKQNRSILYDDVLSFIDYLEEYRYRMGIVTGSIRSQIEPVLGLELLDRFDCVITADDVDYGKPDPQPFIVAAQKLACSSKQLVVIENAPLGIMSAKAAGIGVIALTTTLASYHLRQADAIVSDYAELRRRFGAILSSLEGEQLQPQPKLSPQENRSLPYIDVDFDDY